MDANKVDVLAVMDYAAEMLGQHGWCTSANATGEARAAVAEMIEALRAVKQWNDVSGLDDEWPLVMGSVDAALVRASATQP